MEQFSFTCFVLFITSALYQVTGVTAEKPKIIPALAEITIQEGDQLKLECQGEGKLHFSVEKLTENVEQSEYTTSFDETTGIYTFIRPRTISKDTGWYGCAKEDVVIENDEQTIDHQGEEISWIYVYVNSKHPFAVMDINFQSIVVNTASKVVIPCRPTSPDLPVMLVLNWGEGQIPDDVEYDPKIGFVIQEVGRSQNGETYSCILNGTVVENWYSWPFYALHVLDVVPVPQPTISKDTVHHVVWGEDRTIDCTITIQKSTMFNLDWMAPSSIPTERLNQSQTMKVDKEEHEGKDTWLVQLTIKNVEESDAGNYTCTAEGVGDNNKASASTEIQVWDPSYKYINVTVNGPVNQVPVLEKGNFQWKITIDTYPEEFECQWYKPNGLPINTDDAVTRTKYKHDRTGMQHVFNISRLTIEDSGDYVIQITTPFNVSRTILPLTVVAQPIVYIDHTRPYFMPGSSAKFVCNAISSPLPNITWSYIEYPDFPSRANPIIHPHCCNNTENKPVEKRPFHLQSSLNITINRSGDLICKSCNEIGCTESTELILVSDVGEPFRIVDPGLVTEGDDVALICGASVYNFTDNLTWTVNNSKEQDFVNQRINITDRKTNFTSQRIIQIRNVRRSDSGDYSCSAVNKEGATDTTQYRLTVKGEQTPAFRYSNMNGSEVTIDLKKEKNRAITLECLAEGRPIPKVVWLKNKEPIMGSRQYNFTQQNSRLHISYFLDADSGTYECTATNRIGTASRHMDIKILGKVQPQNNTLWIGLICALIIIIIIVITYMAIRVHRERLLRKELCEAGLTHFVEGALECLNPDLTVDDQAELLPYDKKWEFPRERLKLGKQLGSGAFGVVMKAEARGICEEGEVTTVAVKMVRRTAEPSYMKALSSELKIMIHLGRHLNVVNLLGACTKTILTKRELYVIVEYCRFGNLHNYLQRHREGFIDQIDSSTQKIDPNIGIERLVRSESIGSQNRLKYAALSFSRSMSIKSSDSTSGTELVDYRQGTDFVDISMSPDGGVLSNNSVQPGWRSNYRGDYREQNLKPICTQDLLCWAWQVSRGMEYLSARNVLHGDLAARNILLADNNIVKICDFGLAKNMYKDNNYKKKGDGPLPIKWMAIESIRDRIFSTQSDVWSFGIVLWEFFTLARTPYPGMEAEKQLDRLIEGYRMEKPEFATDEIYDFMLHCWKAKPSLRPTFPELAEKLGTSLNESIRTYYMDLNTPYMEMNTVALQNGQSDYLTMMSSPNHEYLNSPDPTMEARPDSAYLSMGPLNKNGEPDGVFSPRPADLEESHFNFPPPSKNTPINSDSEDCVEAVPMLTTEDPYMKPIDVQQRRAEFVKQSREQTPVERDSGYCNVMKNPHFSNPDDQSSENLKSSDKNLIDKKLQMNNNKDSPSPIISGSDNYVNMPQQKVDRLIDTVDSFSNPSYVIMSKLDQDKQIV